MVKIINKINQVIEKLGQRNFILILFVFFITLIGGLYGTFSIFTSTDGVSVVDGVKTYKFILNPDNTTNSITIAGNSNKFVALTISNPDPTDGKTTTLKYGIYYSSSSTLTNVQIGYLKSSEYKGTDLIGPNKEQVVTLRIDNNTTSNVTITFGVTYGMEKAGDLTLPDGKTWLEKYTGNILTNYVQNLYNDGSTISTANIGGSTSNPAVSLNAGQKIMLDNNGEYRYYGASPNNYVSYNDELWRIISVGTVYKDELDTEGEMRAKIIRADKLTLDVKNNVTLTRFIYDTREDFEPFADVSESLAINDWSLSKLNEMLNQGYYKRTVVECFGNLYSVEEENSADPWSNEKQICDFSGSGLNSPSQKLLDTALFYLGGLTTNENLYADDYYTAERGTNVYNCSTVDIACPRATTWTGKVGVMYPSDYAYATDLSACLVNGYNYDTTNCKSNNWLLDSYAWQWTITPNANYSDYEVNINSTGAIYNTIDNKTQYAGIVKPVVYLKSNVIITGGTGTSTDPYQLALG